MVLSGSILLGAGLVGASQAATLGQFQLLFGVVVGVAAGSFYAPMTSTTTRWFTEHRSLAVALVSSGLGLGSMTVGIDTHGGNLQHDIQAQAQQKTAELLRKMGVA